MACHFFIYLCLQVTEQTYVNDKTRYVLQMATINHWQGRHDH